MIHLPHLSVFGYGSDPENRSQVLHVSSAPEMSGGGTQPPPKPHTPVRKPKPKPKKK